MHKNICFVFFFFFFFGLVLFFKSSKILRGCLVFILKFSRVSFAIFGWILGCVWMKTHLVIIIKDFSFFLFLFGIVYLSLSARKGHSIPLKYPSIILLHKIIHDFQIFLHFSFNIHNWVVGKILEINQQKSKIGF